MSILVATWVSAGAAMVLAVGAGVTAFYAVKAYREQSAQTRLLQEQAQRDIQQRRRAQASRVFVWVEPRPFDGDPGDPRAAASISNTSSQPVYDIVLGLGERADQHWLVLMSGDTHVIPGLGTAFASGQLPVWAAFRDSAGLRWRITADGQLREVADEPDMIGAA